MNIDIIFTKLLFIFLYYYIMSLYYCLRVAIAMDVSRHMEMCHAGQGHC